MGAYTGEARNAAARQAGLVAEAVIQVHKTADPLRIEVAEGQHYNWVGNRGWRLEQHRSGNRRTRIPGGLRLRDLRACWRSLSCLRDALL